MAHHFPQAFVGLGANLGDRVATLKSALTQIDAHEAVTILATSSVYETEPVGGIHQPLFLNLVAGIETTLTPESLLGVLLEIEHKHGRIRLERNGPRTLDLDLLAFEGETRHTAPLTLPHPRMMERPFVLVPLKEVLQHSSFSVPFWQPLRQSLSHPFTSDGVRWMSGNL